MSIERGLPVIDLPIIDYSKAVNNHEGLTNEAEKLVDSFTKYGFCFLGGLDSLGYNKQELDHWIKWFYYLVPKQERFDQLALKGYNPRNPNVYRGLFPTEKGKLSWKEAYDMGSPDLKDVNARNPIMGATPQLKFPNNKKLSEDATKYYKVGYLLKLMPPEVP